MTADLAAPPATATAETAALALHARNVTVTFGGLTAVDSVDLDIAADEVVGLIGGNGAGKTTFMNVVSGYVDAAPGAVIETHGENLIGLSPEYRPYVDVGRSYQAATLFPGLTVHETLMVAVERHNPTPLLAAILGTGKARRIEAEKAEQVDALIDSCGLGQYAERLIRELSTGTRRVVDLACILAQRPGLLLLDEPTGGLAQRETEAFAPLIKRVQAELGCAVMVIEHDMVMIGELCDRVYAMESGRVIASGTPFEVRNDPLVIASYLGTDETTISRSGALSPSASDASADTAVLAADVPGTDADPSDPAAATPALLRSDEELAASSPLADLPRVDLMAVARDEGIPGRSRMRKAELIVAIEAARAAEAAAP